MSIARAASVVYAFLLDGANNTQWRSAVLSISHEAGSPAGVGAIYRQRIKGPGGRPIAGDYEITEARPDTLISFRVISGPARPTGTYHFTERDGATTVHFTLDYQPTGLGRLMDPLIAQSMRGEVAALASLKTCLEAQPG